MDERGFVRFLKQEFPFRFGLGIGDDTSVVPQGEGFQLVTTDILIEDVHFRLEYFTLEELAQKSLAVNLSDIAAMGGIPGYFYLGLGFPQHLGETQVREFFCGLKRGCREWAVDLAGGDFSVSSHLFIAITMIGHALKPVYRHGAQAGDLIGITGPPGESALGLKLLEKGTRNGYFVDKHKCVRPEIAKGQVLSQFATAMIDVSDGLLLDLQRLLDASGKGAVVFYDRLPISPQLTAVCRENQVDETGVVLSGGEDYVLLFTIPSGHEAALRDRGLEYSIIGEITAGPGQIEVRHGDRLIVPHTLGYDHFNR